MASKAIKDAKNNLVKQFQHELVLLLDDITAVTVVEASRRATWRVEAGEMIEQMLGHTPYENMVKSTVEEMHDPTSFADSFVDGFYKRIEFNGIFPSFFILTKRNQRILP